MRKILYTLVLALGILTHTAIAQLTIIGTVTDSGTGNPLDMALVEVVSGFQNITVVETTMTDNKGSYSVTATLSGFINRVRVSKPGFLEAEQFIPFNAQDTVTMDFVLETVPPGDSVFVSGTVTDSSSGSPLQGAYIAVYTTIAQFFADTIGTAITDASGKYQILITTGDSVANLVVVANNYTTKTFTDVTLDSQTTVDFTVVTSPLGIRSPASLPSSQRFNVIVTESEFIIESDELINSIAIFDLSGRLMSSHVLNKQSNRWYVPISALHSGEYFIQVNKSPLIGKVILIH